MRFIPIPCMLSKLFILSYMVLLCGTAVCKQRAKKDALQVTTLYGTYEISEPVLQELFESSGVQRMNYINQYGIDAYVHSYPSYTRYQHSVGVMCILKRFKASLQEQIAGLLHDVSHTVFSHAGDYLFNKKTNTKMVCDKKDSYQDSIHQWFIKQTDIAPILEKYGYTVEDIIHKNGRFFMLEQDAPDLCADRIEYNLYGGLIEKRLTHEDIKQILNALRFKKGKWYFKDIKMARTLADVSLFLTEHHFGSALNGMLNIVFPRLLNHALYKEIITLDDIHFSQDDTVWSLLNASHDKGVKRGLKEVRAVWDYYKEVDEYDLYDYKICPKFRGVNPLIKNKDGSFSRLYEKDAEYAKEYDRVKNKVMSGYFIKANCYEH